MSQIVLVAALEVKPEFRQAVQDFFEAGMIAKSRAEAGNIQYDLHQSLENENMLMMIEIWANSAALDEHNASEHFQAFVAFVDGKLDGLDIKHLNKIA